MNQLTPRPWFVRIVPDGNGTRTTVETEWGNFICLTSETDGPIIAAAPDMLDIIKRLEWSGIFSEGWSCCPICYGINPAERKRHDYDPWQASSYSHQSDCILALTLFAVEGVELGTEGS